jgi:hypothetical protein
MSDNPWFRLPPGPPYVLEEDEDAVRKFNARAGGAHRIQIDKLLPEPFVGDPAAPVLLLSNNPGFGEGSVLRRQPDFMTRIRDGMHLEFSNYPFIYLDPDYSETNSGRWWRQKLKCLLERFGDTVVARSVCNVVYFPYPSTRFRHGGCEVESQKYGFRLVHDAVERGAMIVLMRKGQLKHWRIKVSNLDGYANLIPLRNPQMPSVSPRNCEVGDYDRIVAAIEAAETKRSEASAVGSRQSAEPVATADRRGV